MKGWVFVFALVKKDNQRREEKENGDTLKIAIPLLMSLEMV